MWTTGNKINCVQKKGGVAGKRHGTLWGGGRERGRNTTRPLHAFSALLAYQPYKRYLFFGKGDRPLQTNQRRLVSVATQRRVIGLTALKSMPKAWRMSLVGKVFRQMAYWRSQSPWYQRNNTERNVKTSEKSKNIKRCLRGGVKKGKLSRTMNQKWSPWATNQFHLQILKKKSSTGGTSRE